MNFDDYRNKLPYPGGLSQDPEVKVQRQAHFAENRRLEATFKNDFFTELEIQDNPKRDMLFASCWELGHAHGYHEVMNYGENLVDLIK